MSIRPDLLSWQFSSYADKHRSPLNLWLHLATVPLFWLGLLSLVWALAGGGWAAGAWGGAGLIGAFAAQAVGHRTEPEAPEPFLGAGDFFSRFLVEQLVTFPRFVLSGGWRRHLGR